MKTVRKISIKRDYYNNYSLNRFLNLKSLKNRINQDAFDYDLFNAAIFYCSNQERIKMNLPVCRYHSFLQDSSIIHSVQMKIYDFFGHENPFNLKYRTLRERIYSGRKKNNEIFSCIGENIAEHPILKTNDNKVIVKSLLNKKRFFSIDGMTEIHPYSYEELAIIVVKGWMNSQGHKENILNPHFKFLGCGAVLYEKKKNLLSFSMCTLKITQNFGGELIGKWGVKFPRNKIRIVKKY